MVDALRPSTCHRLLVTLQFLHRREQRERLPLAPVQHQPREAHAGADICLDRKKRLDPLDFARAIKPGDVGRSKRRTLVDGNAPDPAALFGTLQERYHLLGAFEGVEVPREAQVVAPVRLVQEEICQAGVFPALDDLVECIGPLTCRAFEIDRFRPRHGRQVCNGQVYRARFDTVR